MANPLKTGGTRVLQGTKNRAMCLRCSKGSIGSILIVLLNRTTHPKRDAKDSETIATRRWQSKMTQNYQTMRHRHSMSKIYLRTAFAWHRSQRFNQETHFPGRRPISARHSEHSESWKRGKKIWGHLTLGSLWFMLWFHYVSLPFRDSGKEWKEQLARKHQQSSKEFKLQLITDSDRPFKLLTHCKFTHKSGLTSVVDKHFCRGYFPMTAKNCLAPCVLGKAAWFFWSQVRCDPASLSHAWHPFLLSVFFQCLLIPRFV